MTANIPTHLGFIVDGNRRWAKAQGRDATDGHEKGIDTLKERALDAYDRGVKYVSAYIFSKENWARTEKEVGFLMNLVADYPTKYVDDFHQKGIKIVFLGTKDRLNPKVLASINKSEEKTKNNARGTLALCFNYGGQQEIIDAAKKMAKEGITDVDEAKFASLLYHPEIPAIDLIIRTSGEQRISGFMLWRAAYSELIFVDKYWPDFTRSDLDSALSEYSKRQRRFGA